jgi:hypothetical protein
MKISLKKEPKRSCGVFRKRESSTTVIADSAQDVNIKTSQPMRLCDSCGRLPSEMC